MSAAEALGLFSMTWMPVMAAIGAMPRVSPYSIAHSTFAGLSWNDLGSMLEQARLSE
jgi:hypothetical protein